MLNLLSLATPATTAGISAVGGKVATTSTSVKTDESKDSKNNPFNIILASLVAPNPVQVQATAIATPTAVVKSTVEAATTASSKPTQTTKNVSPPTTAITDVKDDSATKLVAQNLGTKGRQTVQTETLAPLANSISTPITNLIPNKNGPTQESKALATIEAVKPTAIETQHTTKANTVIVSQAAIQSRNQESSLTPARSVKGATSSEVGGAAIVDVKGSGADALKPQATTVSVTGHAGPVAITHHASSPAPAQIRVPENLSSAATKDSVSTIQTEPPVKAKGNDGERTPPVPAASATTTNQPNNLAAAAVTNLSHVTPARSLPTVPPGTSSVAAPTLANQLADAIHTRIDTARGGAVTNFTIRLDPPQLGTVHVHLQAVGETGLHARLVVADEAVRAAVESQLNGLRQRLDGSGVSLGRLDVANRESGSGQPGASTGEPSTRKQPTLKSVSATISREVSTNSVNVVV